MKKYTFLIAIAALFLIQTACNSDPKEGKEEQLSERELLYKEVMKIHDAVMPKMSELNRVKRSLKDQITTDSIIPEDVISKVNYVIDELSAAETEMMDWMQGFKVPKENAPDKEVIDYLNKEKQSITKVSHKMLESLENGTGLLEALKKEL